MIRASLRRAAAMTVSGNGCVRCTFPQSRCAANVSEKDVLFWRRKSITYNRSAVAAHDSTGPICKVYAKPTIRRKAVVSRERPINVNTERRSATLALEPEPQVIEGYAARFDSLSVDLGGFRETIQRGAFANSLKQAESDPLALWNHDSSMPLGRRSAGTLELSEDRWGLKVKITGDRTSWAQDAAESVRSGTVKGMSFGFIAKSDRWQRVEGEWRRTLLEADLREVSLVPQPAYPQTTASVS